MIQHNLLVVLQDQEGPIVGHSPQTYPPVQLYKIVVRSIQRFNLANCQN